MWHLSLNIHDEYLSSINSCTVKAMDLLLYKTSSSRHSEIKGIFHMDISYRFTGNVWRGKCLRKQLRRLAFGLFTGGYPVRGTLSTRQRTRYPRVSFIFNCLLMAEMCVLAFISLFFVQNWCLFILLVYFEKAGHYFKLVCIHSTLSITAFNPIMHK